MHEKRVAPSVQSLKTPRCGFRARKKITLWKRGKEKKGYCRCRRAIGLRKGMRKTVNVVDDTLLFGHRKWNSLMKRLSLSLFLSSSLPPPSPSHFDADKSSLLKKIPRELLRADIWTPDSLSVADEVCVNEERATSFPPRGERLFLRCVLNKLS